MNFRSARRVLFSVPFLFIFLYFFSSQVFASTIFEDNFDDTDGTTLSTHNSMWKEYDIGLNEAIIQNNQVKSNGSNSGYYIPSLLQMSDYCVQADFHYPLPNTGPPDFFGISTRREDYSLEFHHYEAGINVAENIIYLIRDNYSGNNLLFSETPTLSNGLHKMKLCSIGSNQSLFIDGNLITTVDDSTYDSGAPGFDLGNNTPLDNFLVTTPDPVFLDVPYFSQNTSPWGPSEYDNAKTLKFDDPTMNRWGCAVTSAAMVLNYHGITKLADGTTLNPGSLNTWLKNNHGYLEGSGSDGSYSYLIWPTIASLTKKIFNAGKSQTELMYQRLYPSSSTTSNVNTDVTTDTPDIFAVSNTLTSMHFVVAKGKQDNTYLINDPEWNNPDLTSFGNTYSQVDRFMPSHTDLSYLVAITNPDTEISIASSSGQRVGKLISGGTSQTFFEISGATYAFENPISNPDSNDTPQSLGTGVNVLYLPIPNDGAYNVTVSGNKNVFYTLNLALFQIDGTETTATVQGTVDPKNPDSFTVDYERNGDSNVVQDVTYNSLLADINQLESLGYFGKSVAKSLTALVKTIEKNAKKKNARTVVPLELSVFEAEIKILTPQLMTQFAYQELYSDAESLKSSL